MTIEFAHLRERSTTGGWINFAIFNADSPSRTNHDRNALLNKLTFKAKANGLRVDQSALAFEENGHIRFYGDPNLVRFLSTNWYPVWTHKMGA